MSGRTFASDERDNLLDAMRATKPKKVSRQRAKQTWKPKVKLLATLVRWTKKGPVGGKPGKWSEQIGRALGAWLEKQSPPKPFVGFTRCGKLYGVVGPAYLSPESRRRREGPNVPLKHNPNSPIIATMFNVSLGWQVDDPGFQSRHTMRQYPAWIEDAYEAIAEWEKRAPWAPVVGYIEHEQAWGVIPPKDGKPLHWRELADVVWQEYERESEIEQREFEAEEKERRAKAEAADDGLGWLSPKYDAMFEEVGIGEGGRKAWAFVQEGPTMNWLLRYMQGLAANPRWPSFGHVRETFLGQIQEALTQSHRVIQELYAYQKSDNADHDSAIMQWAGQVLVDHYASIVRQWKQWEEWRDRALDKNNRGNPNAGVAKHDDGFFVRAMAGMVQQKDGKTKAFNSLPPDWFQARFDELVGNKKRHSLEGFVDHCLYLAGYFKSTEARRQENARHADYERREAQAQIDGVPWKPVLRKTDPKPSPILASIETPTYPRLTEEQFSHAWNHNLPKFSNSKLLAIIIAFKAKHGWGRGVETHLQAAWKEPLPIKAVMLHEHKALEVVRAMSGRAPKQTGGNRKPGVGYLGDDESDLKEMTRELFGLPSRPESSHQAGG